MESIKLDFDDEDTPTVHVDPNQTVLKTDCLGITCNHFSKHETFGFWCNAVDRMVWDLYDDIGRCPRGKWKVLKWGMDGSPTEDSMVRHGNDRLESQSEFTYRNSSDNRD